MPLRRMPNGEYVDVPDNISPQALAKIESQYKATRASRGDTPRTVVRAQNNTPSLQEAAISERERQKKQRESRTGLSGFIRDAKDFTSYLDPTEYVGGLVKSGLLFNFDDELQGVGLGIRNLVEGKGFSSGYNLGREIRNQEKYEARRDNPVYGTIAEIGGSLLNPIGTGANFLKIAGSLGGKLAPRAGAVLTRAGNKIDEAGAITKGVLTGANAGTLNAVGSSENLENAGGDAVFGGALGAGLGGALGVLGRAGQGAYRILRDRSPQAAKRVAAQQVQKMLERGEITPETANKMLQKANREGGDAMLMDVNPALSSEAGILSRNINLRNSNKLIQRGESRAETRRGRIASKIEDTAELPKGIKDFNALREGDDLLAARKGIGSRDYADDGALDAKINWSEELENAVKSAPNFERLMNSAFSRAQQFGDDLGKIDTTDGNKLIPSMRVWDYLKREYDSVIKQAYRAGDETTGAAYSAELGRIKDQIAKANPKYQEVLAGQRDYFQQQKALELGQKLWKSLAKSPRQTKRALAAMQPKELDQARIGIIDTMINEVLTSGNPVGVITKIKNEKTTREVLETVFGGKQRYNQFMRYLRTEARGAQADSVTRYGGQSQTSRLQQAGASTESDLSELGVGGVSGFAFGGVPGVGANIGRRLIQMAKVTSNDAQDEIAKLLMSRGGDDFLEAMRNAVRYKKQQLMNNDSVTKTLARGGQQVFTTAIGGE